MTHVLICLPPKAFIWVPHAPHGGGSGEGALPLVVSLSGAEIAGKTQPGAWG